MASDPQARRVFTKMARLDTQGADERWDPSGPVPRDGEPRMPATRSGLTTQGVRHRADQDLDETPDLELLVDTKRLAPPPMPREFAPKARAATPVRDARATPPITPAGDARATPRTATRGPRERGARASGAESLDLDSIISAQPARSEQLGTSAFWLAPPPTPVPKRLTSAVGPFLAGAAVMAAIGGAFYAGTHVPRAGIAEPSVAQPTIASRSGVDALPAPVLPEASRIAVAPMLPTPPASPDNPGAASSPPSQEAIAGQEEHRWGSPRQLSHEVMARPAHAVEGPEPTSAIAASPRPSELHPPTNGELDDQEESAIVAPSSPASELHPPAGGELDGQEESATAELSSSATELHPPTGDQVDGQEESAIAETPITQRSLDQLMREALPAPTTIAASNAGDTATAELPLRPSRTAIRSALTAVTSGLRACTAHRGVAMMNITLSGAGSVLTARPVGDWAGDANAACLRSAIDQAHIPRFIQPQLTVQFPFVL